MPRHEILTKHIREMIDAAHTLANLAEIQKDQELVDVPAYLITNRGDGNRRTHEACLRQAAQLLRHAAAELDAEAQSCAGWAQI